MLFVLTIAALGVALVLGNRESAKLKEQLALLSPDPYLRVYSGSPVIEKYSPNSGMAVTGAFHPLNYEFSGEPAVVAKLIEIKTSQEIVKLSTTLNGNPNGKGFSFTLEPDKSLAPGFYAIEVSLFDGVEEIASTTVVKEVFDFSILKQD